MSNTPIKILLTLVIMISSALILTQALDKQGQQYTDDALKRALLTFGIARSLNGVISVAQGTEIALQPAGIGLTFTPGQILDPLNDLVERFSGLMLISSASIGIQKTLLTISAWPWFSGMTLFFSAAALMALWWPKPTLNTIKTLCIKLALITIVLRLSVPLIAIGNAWVYQEFLSPQYEKASQQLQQTSNNIGRINQQSLSPHPPADSLLESAKQFYDSATQHIDIEAKLAQYKIASANASEYLINLMVVFLFQTLILPLLFLAAAYAVIKNLFRSRGLLLGGS